MKVKTKKAIWNTVADLALIFAGVQIADKIPIPQSKWGWLIVLVVIVFALIEKNYFME